MDHAEPDRAGRDQVGRERTATVPSSQARSANRWLALQRRAGNAAVTRALQRDDATSTGGDGTGGGGAQQKGGAGGVTPNPSWTKFADVAGPELKRGGTFDQFANAFAGIEAGQNTVAMVDSPTQEDGTNLVSAQINIELGTSIATWDPQTPSTDTAIAAKEQAEYKRFQDAMKAHEKGHADLSRTNYKDVHKQMLGKPKDTALDTAWAAAKKTDDDANTKYDADNQHGVTGTPSTKINTNFGQTIKVP